MTTALTPDLAALETLLAAATPAPWSIRGREVAEVGVCGFVLFQAQPWANEVATTCAQPRHEADAALIAALRAKRLEPRPGDTVPPDSGPPTEREPAPARASRKPPATRAECVDLPRPCEASRCRHFLDRSVGGTNCALDVADSGGATQDEVAAALGVSHGLVDHIETRALAKLRSVLDADRIRDLFDNDDFDMRISFGPAGGDR